MKDTSKATDLQQPEWLVDQMPGVEEYKQLLKETNQKVAKLDYQNIELTKRIGWLWNRVFELEHKIKTLEAEHHDDA